ncbi:uncharacterized protein N7459_002453 [Penicillium hispanicum]|uniref:uncharacterized protein n=1 Tax=Penicillium hispanicum TaxID=1080232 RepID=UPI002541FA17|nr:uncharacterized protein N7459_002453 [Penicillium hispanicum]KAJ5586688.1 hypothetical protein N7459_002453 [Penicillium hispanicum]
MGKHGAEDAAMQPAAVKPSRYRQTQDGQFRAHHIDKTESMAQASGGRKSSEQNPSIVRSMSRYRRNRPSGHGNTAAVPSVPRLPVESDHASTKPVPPLPAPAQEDPEVPERSGREREKHRQNAMDQLTGGSPVARSIPLRPTKSTKETYSRKERSKQEQTAALTQQDYDGHGNHHTPPSDAPRKSFLQKVKLAKTKDSPGRDEATIKYIAMGGGGIVPGTDAPISAVNAGERHVVVQYSDAAVKLPVTPTTLAQDILSAAYQQVSPCIDPAKFIVIESFHQIGLERPLRRYERVRDVLNSWTHDLDNRLIIIPPSSMEALAQVDAQEVPSEKPTETTVELYHSPRPRKWDKRFVTLRADGQVMVSKKENSKDHTNICHLTDFDIYSPSARALAKDIKPPKKLCFAIKSQEKSSMFLSTENFVHFFATSDRAVADRWHRAVQGWRSWYLVNKMGAGQPLENAIAPPAEPLMHVQTSADQPRPSSSKDIFSRKRTVRERVPPSTSYPKGLSVDTSGASYQSEKASLVQGISPEEVNAETFSPAGLLGRTYTQRRQAMREREEREKQAKHDPFSPHGLLNGVPMFPTGNVEGADAVRPGTAAHTPAAGGYLGRGHSVSQKNKPLVDLTPVFQEPPQHTRKGRGVTVQPGKQLIDAATGPDLAPGSVAIPAATAWRRPSVDASSHGRNRANTMRSVRHTSQHHNGSSSAGESPSSPTNPFMPNSLLASSSSRRTTSQGKPSAGHGLTTGDRHATHPMLDMSPENPFAEGSLLRQL